MTKTTGDFKLSKFLLDVLLDIVIVFVLVVLIRSFLFAPFRVNGPSMCNTFNFYDGECFSGNGEFILTTRPWMNELERGDVIVFSPPEAEKGEYFIKRVIGVPGDSVEIKNGLVYLNGEELVEDYLSDENVGSTYAYRAQSAEYEVPEDNYFVLGDNRKKSSDSRRCFRQLGCDDGHSPYVSNELIEGEVRLVMFPFSHIRLVRDVEY